MQNKGIQHATAYINKHQTWIEFELFTDWVTYLGSKDIYLLWGQRFLDISTVMSTVLEAGSTTAALVAAVGSERSLTATEITR